MSVVCGEMAVTRDSIYFAYLFILDSSERDDGRRCRSVCVCCVACTGFLHKVPIADFTSRY